MTKYLSFRPDYFPRNYDSYQFKKYLTRAEESHKEGYLYKNKKGFYLVNLISKVVETVKGWAGLTNHTNILNVNYDLLKLLHFGQKKSYLTDPKTFELVRKMKEYMDEGNHSYSTSVYEMISMFCKNRFNPRNSQESEKILMDYYKTNEEKLYPYFFNRLLTATTIPEDSHFTFGNTYLSLACTAITSGRYSEGYEQIASAFEQGNLDGHTEQFLCSLLLQLANHSDALDAKAKYGVKSKLREYAEKNFSALEYENAANLFEGAINLSSDKSLKLRFAQASYLAGMDKNIIKYADLLIEQSPHNPDTYLRIAKAYSLEGEYAKAIVCYKKACELRPSGDNIQLYLSELLVGAEKSIRNAPMESVGIFKRMFVPPKKDYSQAEIYLEQFMYQLKAKPSFLSSFQFDGILEAIYRVQENPKIAAFATEMASLYINESKEKSRILSGKEQKAHITEKKPLLEKAIRWLDRANQIQPEAETHFQKGCVYEYLQEIDSGYDPLPDYLRAYEMQPDNGYYNWAVTLMYNRKGDTQNQEKYRDLFPSGRCDVNKVTTWFEEKFLADSIQIQHRY